MACRVGMEEGGVGLIPTCRKTIGFHGNPSSEFGMPTIVVSATAPISLSGSSIVQPEAFKDLLVIPSKSRRPRCGYEILSQKNS